MTNNYNPTKWVEHRTVATANVMNNIEKGIVSAHEKLSEVDSQINTKANDTTLLEQEKILKEVLSSDAIKISQQDIVYYQATIKNPISIVYNNVPIALKVKFDKGECLNEKRIIVKDNNNNIIPFQWEGEKHPHYLLKDTHNLATYNDGSLNGGTIWIMGNLITATPDP